MVVLMVRKLDSEFKSHWVHHWPCATTKQNLRNITVLFLSAIFKFGEHACKDQGKICYRKPIIQAGMEPKEKY